MFDPLFVIVGFLLGLIIGSFLNVVILRLHTKRTLGGYSHCMSCGERLSALDLVPLFSYLSLLGRCRHCGARISPRYFLIELTSATMFASIFALGFDPLTTVLHLVFLALLLVVFVYDVEHLIIPDEYALALMPFALMFHVWNGVAFTVPHWSVLVAPAASFIFLGGLWRISGGKWIGLGDAKLSIPLAVAVGLSQVFSLIVFAFWIGAFMSVVILFMQRLLKSIGRGQTRLRFLGRPLTMKAEVPFAPFLIGSFLVIFYAKGDAFYLTDIIVSWLTSLVT